MPTSSSTSTNTNKASKQDHEEQSSTLLNDDNDDEDAEGSKAKKDSSLRLVFQEKTGAKMGVSVEPDPMEVGFNKFLSGRLDVDGITSNFVSSLDGETLGPTKSA